MIVHCEHCGLVNTETKQYEDDDGVQWCVACAYANDLITYQELSEELEDEE